MHMWFWWGYQFQDLLFPGYNVCSIVGFVATCSGILALAILFEFIKLLQIKHHKTKLMKRSREIRQICPTETGDLITSTTALQEPGTTFNERLIMHIKDFSLGLNQLLGYFLMLLVMSFNGWFLISVVVGSGVGYFIFGPSFMKITFQSKKIVQETFCNLKCGQPEDTNEGESTPVLQPSTSSTDISTTHTNGHDCSKS